MKKLVLKSQQSLIDAEKVIRLANDVIVDKINNLDEIKDENLQVIVKDGINYQRDKNNSVGSTAFGSIGILGGVEVVHRSIKHSANASAKGAAIVTSGLKNMGKKIGVPSMKGGLLASVTFPIIFGTGAFILGKLFIPPMDKNKKRELLSESEKIFGELSSKIFDAEANNLEFLLVIKLLVKDVTTYLKDDLGIA